MKSDGCSDSIASVVGINGINVRAIPQCNASLAETHGSTELLEALAEDGGAAYFRSVGWAGLAWTLRLGH